VHAERVRIPVRATVRGGGRDRLCRAGQLCGGERVRVHAWVTARGCGRGRSFRAGNGAEGERARILRAGNREEGAGEGGARGRRHRAGNQPAAGGFDSRSKHRAGNCAVNRFRASSHRVITRATGRWSGEEAATPRRSSFGQPGEGEARRLRAKIVGWATIPRKAGRFRAKTSFGYPDGVGIGKTRDRVVIWATEWRWNLERISRKRRAAARRVFERAREFRGSRGNVARATGRRSFGKLETKCSLGEPSEDEGPVRRRKWKEGSKTRTGGQPRRRRCQASRE
jgi:hypothetical protein